MLALAASLLHACMALLHPHSTWATRIHACIQQPTHLHGLQQPALLHQLPKCCEVQDAALKGRLLGLLPALWLGQLLGKLRVGPRHLDLRCASQLQGAAGARLQPRRQAAARGLLGSPRVGWHGGRRWHLRAGAGKRARAEQG